MAGGMAAEKNETTSGMKTSKTKTRDRILSTSCYFHKADIRAIAILFNYINPPFFCCTILLSICQIIVIPTKVPINPNQPK